jgi:hypothetical protein
MLSQNFNWHLLCILTKLYKELKIIFKSLNELRNKLISYYSDDTAVLNIL